MINSTAKVGILRILIAVLAQAIYAVPVFAQTSGIDIGTKEKVVAAICNIASAMFWILIALSTVMVLYGAFLYLTGGADAEKVKSAHKTITYAAVGVVVAILAKGFPFIVANIFSATGLPNGC